jgi:hypothetical protein
MISMHLDVVEKVVVWYSWIQYPKLILFSAMADLYGRSGCMLLLQPGVS